MKLGLKFLLGLAMASGFTHVMAEGWPANYEGVMLQGFYWDSYAASKWTVLEGRSDELSKYFKLIWVPNSGNCGAGNQMGYMPQYWFSNHNGSFGTESELRSMIKSYREKGTGIIEDVVINHRNGVKGWYDFPVETWNGRTWSIGLDGICSNDNLATAPGQPKPTGAMDTGDLFDGCRDLDHTNANVQDNCKNYCKFLLEDLGYAGFRYDMVKGYAGEYTGMYNKYSGPEFSVGEYWDANYDAVARWIDATGKESAAFDFPFKYAVNEAFSSNDMTKLVWLANGSNPQPAGLIHFGYSQYSVTFVDNHDTYRDGSKFNGNVPAANAFMLCSPGTPCVFLPHYEQYKNEIRTLIDIRNKAGIHNNSAVKVLKSTSDCYMAEVTGSKGKVVVKIGKAMASPDGYTDSQIAAAGNDYCVWSTSGGNNQGGGDDTVDMPEKLYILGNLASGSWQTNNGVEMTKSGDTFVAKKVDLKAEKNETKAFFTFVTQISNLSDDWTTVNGSDRYGAAVADETISVSKPGKMMKYPVNISASSAASWGVAPGVYDITADFKTMTVSVATSGSGSDTPADKPIVVYYDNTVTRWTTPHIYYWNVSSPTYPGVAMTKVAGEENVWMYECPAGTEGILFNAGDGDASKSGDFIPVDQHIYSKQNGDMGVFVSTGIEIIAEDNEKPVYFNLQGLKVSNPEKGNIYIRVKGNKTQKVRL